MINTNIDGKVRNSTKWTMLTEFLSKIISPITGMLLARLLTPEAFGIMASIMVVTSFAEIFADAGFQKYFIQHEFYDEDEKRKCFNAALWTSCIISGFIWLIIALFSYQIAELLGTSEVSEGIKVAGLGLVLNSYNGMQSALFKRSFQFKLLFKLRMILSIVPLVITIPMAFFGAGFWALIFGMLAQQSVTCIVQAYYTDLKIELKIDFIILKKMLSFSLWTLLESITIWFSTYGGMFFIGVLLSNYYLGIYRGIMSIWGAIFGVITAAIMPVLFVALSRLQNDLYNYKRIFYDMQRKISLFLFPLGGLLFIFPDLAVEILLGEQWHEGDFLFGAWSLTSSFSILINSMASEALRAKGMPRLSAFSQMFHFPVLWLALWYGAKIGFDAVVLGMCASSLWLDVVKIIMLRQALGFSLRRIIDNIFNGAVPVGIAGALAWHLRQVWEVYGIFAIVSVMIIFLVCYLLLILIRHDNRQLLMEGMVFLQRKL